MDFSCICICRFVEHSEWQLYVKSISRVYIKLNILLREFQHISGSRKSSPPFVNLTGLFEAVVRGEADFLGEGFMPSWLASPWARAMTERNGD